MEIGENFLKAKFTEFESPFSPFFMAHTLEFIAISIHILSNKIVVIFFSLKKNMSALNCIYCIGIHMERNGNMEPNGNTDVNKNSAYSRQTWVKYTHIRAVISFVLNWLLPFCAFYAY